MVHQPTSLAISAVTTLVVSVHKSRGDNVGAVEEMACVDGCDLVSTFCKYDLRKGDLFVLSWARMLQVRRGSISSELLMCGGGVRSILLLPLVARCLETIDVCIWQCFVFYVCCSDWVDVIYFFETWSMWVFHFKLSFICRPKKLNVSTREISLLLICKCR